MIRSRIAAFAFALLCLSAPAAWADGHASVDGSPKILGDPNAPVTIIEYASLSCPHCAMFHAERLPWLKETFIDTGRIKLEFRDFPLNAPALWGAMLAHCAGPDSYFAYLDFLFKKQPQWAFTEEPQTALKAMAKQAGMAGDKFDACMKNESLQDAIIESRRIGIEDANVEATPSFVIDGETISGIPEETDFTARIEAAGG
jgi:protein-disulfide isomerase